MLERCQVDFYQEDFAVNPPLFTLHLRHNLFSKGAVILDEVTYSGTWTVKDNLFDCDTLSAIGGGWAADYNGYRTNLTSLGGAGNWLNLAPDYRSGPAANRFGVLGKYYYPTSGGVTSLAALINAGSQTAIAAGLDVYTTQRDQMTDSGTVDIGFHYAVLPTGPGFWTDYSPSPEQLAKWIMAGSGATVVAGSVTYTGAGVARGIFANGTSAAFPIDTGVILSTGDIALARGPNDNSAADKLNFHWSIPSGDSDLENLVPDLSTYDAAVLDFYIVSPVAKNLALEFIFASEEYPEWISDFNDIVAIFVDGVNIAPVPGTTLPVAVNYINGGCVSSYYGRYVAATHPEPYYKDNHDPSYSALPPYAAPDPVYNIEYDSITILPSAQTSISANVTYHVKIAIADANDNQYDSAVFIKAQVPCP